MCNRRVAQLAEATSAQGHPWGDIPHHKPWSWWEWGKRRRGRGGLLQWGWPVDKGTSPEVSSRYKVELLVLHDWKVMTFCAICIIPWVPCLPCNYSFEHSFLHISERETEICSVIYVGSWSCGGPWRSTSKRIQQITEDHWKYRIGRPWCVWRNSWNGPCVPAWAWSRTSTSQLGKHWSDWQI